MTRHKPPSPRETPQDAREAPEAGIAYLSVPEVALRLVMEAADERADDLEQMASDYGDDPSRIASEQIRAAVDEVASAMRAAA